MWTETIETHRRQVHGAILSTTAALVAEHGLASVTMSQIAEQAGIGRATLYKYFSDVDAILYAWHERQVNDHLRQLIEVRDRVVDPGQRLEAVLDAYAHIRHRLHQAHQSELASVLHRDPHLARAQQQLNALLTELVADAAKAGDVRDDVPADELARYGIYAIAAADRCRSKAAVDRLVAVTMAGLRPARRAAGERQDE